MAQGRKQGAAQSTPAPQGAPWRRRSRWVATLAGVSLLATACGTMPGAAVDIDGTQTSVQAVQERTQELMDQYLPDAPSHSASRALLNRQQLTDVVRHQLVLAAADAEDLTVSDADVNSLISRSDGADAVGSVLLVPGEDAADAVYDFLALVQLIDTIPDEGTTVVDVQTTLDIVPAADQATAAEDRTRYLNDPAAMDADAAASDLSATDVEISLLDPALSRRADLAAQGVFTAKDGAILVIPPVPGVAPEWQLVRVNKHVEDRGTLSKDLLNQLAGQSPREFMALASLLLAPYAEQADLTINPRFGQWDPHILQVVASSGAR